MRKKKKARYRVYWQKNTEDQEEEKNGDDINEQLPMTKVAPRN